MEVDEHLFNSQLFTLVVDEKGSVICEHNKILMQRNEDEQLIYAAKDIVEQHFNLQDYELNPSSEDNETYDLNNSAISVEASLSERERVPWVRDDILQLIHLYKQFQNSFKSTTIKNDKVWNLISQELKSHTAEQCKNKFKYLKQKYIEKKDNMKDTSSEAKRITFQYFYLFEELFSGDVDITHIATASSSKGILNIPPGIISQKSGSFPEDLHKMEQCSISENPKKKRKPTELLKQLNKYEENLEKREEARENRHRERMEKQTEATSALRSIADSFAKIANSYQ